jgi:hypothetical protein
MIATANTIILPLGIEGSTRFRDVLQERRATRPEGRRLIRRAVGRAPSSRLYQRRTRSANNGSFAATRGESTGRRKGVRPRTYAHAMAAALRSPRKLGTDPDHTANHKPCVAEILKLSVRQP